jgi:ribonuclease D
VVKEQNLLEIAKKQPTNKAALASVPGINHHEIRIHGEAILLIIQNCQETPSSSYPPRVERLTEYSPFKKVSTAIREVCKQVADELEIPIEIVGSKKQVNQLISWCWFKHDELRAMDLEPDLISGWRREFFLSKLLGVDELKLAENVT